jgi:hypothetical protein
VDAPGAEDEAPQPFWPKRISEAGMSSEAVMRVCIERCKERAGPRLTILPLSPHYHVRGERAMLVSGRKRLITTLDEAPAFSSVSDDSASTDSSRPPRFRRSTKLELEDEWGSARHTSGGRPAMSVTEVDRGGGFAPRIVETSIPRTVITRHCLRLMLLRLSLMPAAMNPRVAGHRCLTRRCG